MKRLILFSLAWCSMLLLAACGGGGTDDRAAPQVTATSPATDAVGVSTRTAITATFDETMDAATVNSLSFTLDDGVTFRVGAVSVSGGVVSFTPATPLADDTVYTATLTTALKDAVGNGLAASHRWQFRTAPAPDRTAPTVLSTLPAANAVAVEANATVSATLSEPLDAATVDAATLSLSNGATGTVSLAGNTITLTPSAPLLTNRVYTATVQATVRDAAGNAVAVPFSWSFSTGATLDAAAPAVIATTPAADATDASTDRAITVLFSERLDPATLTQASFKVAGVSGTVSYVDGVARFLPDAQLAYQTTYTATLTTDVKDLFGNALQAPVTWRFTTGRRLATLFAIAARSDAAIAVGALGTIETSTDGTSWTSRTSGTVQQLNAVAASAATVVVVGDAGTILTSSDLSTWTARPSGTTLPLLAVAWTGAQFIAVGSSGTILTSADGIAWLAQASGTTSHLYGVASNGATSVVVGAADLLVSSNGATWAPAMSASGYGSSAVVWAGNQFVIGGGSNNAGFQTSPDGTHWTYRREAMGNAVRSLAWSGANLFSVGTFGTLQSSADGATWDGVASPYPYTDYNAVAWFKGSFLAVGGAGTVRKF